MRFPSAWFYSVCILLCIVAGSFAASAQKRGVVYVDRAGVLRWSKDNKEAAFFGVNYTVPFAYGYRSVKALGVKPEKAIDADVYHFARLGFDAFRVHVWDTEITDTAGNLKANDHLRLFDYLISKLKERNIKIFLTPLAFWGSGYPERDQNTGSFSSRWNKQQVLVTEAAIQAQEAYLQQLLKHVNPYTKLTYGADPDIIALEINNEPQHSGLPQQAADYIARMVQAVKSTGWNKPVFYNISESPRYAGAVASAPIDGVSFQWYPTGLVANRSLQGNYLPHVDLYRIPFGDSLPAYRNKARMVYEFDAGDVPQSYLYPAMARSFRTAGFQWATQFAYDPMATAYGNTEYQTHYLNLAYTPSKAISLLIAGQVFRRVPRLKSYGAYPADTLFDVFRVSYHQNLSEMNTDTAFYYSNSTSTQPLDTTKLKHIAGVGSSPVVRYEGTGAYFLDQIEPGLWRLEVMPDAVPIRDPFAKASPRKEVTRIQWQPQLMEISLPDLGSQFKVGAINKDNTYSVRVNGGPFLIRPGVYRVSVPNKEYKLLMGSTKLGAIRLNEYVAPAAAPREAFVDHTPVREVSAGKDLVLHARVVGVDTTARLMAEVRHSANLWKTVPLQRVSAYGYRAVVPAEMVLPGVLNYRIIVRQTNRATSVFPGNHLGDPYAWDAYINESWETFVAAPGAPLELFNATRDRDQISLYNPDWRANRVHYITAEEPGALVLRAEMTQPDSGQLMGWHCYAGDVLAARAPELNSFDRLVIKARAEGAAPTRMKVALITKDAQAFAAYVTLPPDLKEIEVPLADLRPDSALLLPRPYPGFLPLWFRPAVAAPFDLGAVEKLEVSFAAAAAGRPTAVQVAYVRLRQRK